MCEHENFFTAVNAPNNPEVQVACHDCKQFIGHPDDVIFGLKQEIAAANARIAELEQNHDSLINSYGELLEKYQHDLCIERNRAEQAEAKVKRLIKNLTYNTPSFRDGKCDEELLTIDENELVPLKSCMCDRLKQAEAQCNQMEAECADFQAIIKRLQEENAKRFNDNTAMHERMMGAEAQNKRMRESLEEIKQECLDDIDCGEESALGAEIRRIIAALEGKP